jgi:uncharacterized protein
MTAQATRLPLRQHLAAIFYGAVLSLAACGSSGPPPVEYVLGAAPAPAPSTNALAGRPVAEVRPVRLPDYLDTRELVVRSGNQLLPSKTGQWAERLSVGMTRALALSLGMQLPNVTVLTTNPIERPTWQVLVDVTAFEARVDREVVLAARWTVTDGTGRSSLQSEDAVLMEPTESMDDAAVVSAMNRAVEGFASQIAAGIKRHVLLGDPSVQKPMPRLSTFR